MRKETWLVTIQIPDVINETPDQVLEVALANASPRIHEFRIGVQRPQTGQPVKCLLCGLDKPWGTFSETTGAAVCMDCRDAAYLARRRREIDPMTFGEERKAWLREVGNEIGKQWVIDHNQELR